MTHEQERRARRSLLERWHAARDRYVAQRDAHGQTSLSDANPDALAADPVAVTVLDAFAHADARELESIVHALRRLRAGVYGRCIVCGGTIAADQLERMPEAVMCSSCASARESHGEAHSPG